MRIIEQDEPAGETPMTQAEADAWYERERAEREWREHFERGD